MCATCVYLFLENGPIDLDGYFAAISRLYDVTRKSQTSFELRWSGDEAVDIDYCGSDDPMMVLSDQYNGDQQGTPRYIRPEHLVPLIDWHVENLGVEPDHVLGYSNHFFEEFKQVYLRKPIRYSHFTPVVVD